MQNDEPGIEVPEQYSPDPQAGTEPEQRPFTIVWPDGQQ
jgi:hypothetical protein